jgi:hypothetical protein
LETRPFHRTAEPPAAASVEPITPPMSACEELDGMPKSQVMRFQIMPPAKPAASTDSVTSAVLTRPFAIVAATASERNAPIRLSRPDKATATRGGSAPVAIEVAITLPVSWKPLVKSKARAVMTTSARTTSFLMENSVSTRQVAVGTRSARVKRLSSAVRQVFTDVSLDGADCGRRHRG